MMLPISLLGSHSTVSASPNQPTVGIFKPSARLLDADHIIMDADEQLGNLCKSQLQ